MDAILLIIGIVNGVCRIVIKDSWHLCSEQNTNKMEKIQSRGLKFIYDDTDSTYEELLTKSKLPTLKIRRIRTIAIEHSKLSIKPVRCTCMI
jgi:CRISPR/Cas system-associated endoribonuclease Cas2